VCKEYKGGQGFARFKAVWLSVQYSKGVVMVAVVRAVVKVGQRSQKEWHFEGFQAVCVNG